MLGEGRGSRHPQTARDRPDGTELGLLVWLPTPQPGESWLEKVPWAPEASPRLGRSWALRELWDVTAPCCGPSAPGPPRPQELLKETRKEHTLRAVELLYSVFCLDMQQATLVLLGHILPGLLTDSSKWHSLMDPPGTALAK